MPCSLSRSVSSASVRAVRLEMMDFWVAAASTKVAICLSRATMVSRASSIWRLCVWLVLTRAAIAVALPSAAVAKVSRSSSSLAARAASWAAGLGEAVDLPAVLGDLLVAGGESGAEGGGFDVEGLVVVRELGVGCGEFRVGVRELGLGLDELRVGGGGAIEPVGGGVELRLGLGEFAADPDEIGGELADLAGELVDLGGAGGEGHLGEASFRSSSFPVWVSLAMRSVWAASWSRWVAMVSPRFFWVASAVARYMAKASGLGFVLALEVRRVVGGGDELGGEGVALGDLGGEFRVGGGEVLFEVLDRGGGAALLAPHGVERLSSGGDAPFERGGCVGHAVAFGAEGS